MLSVEVVPSSVTTSECEVRVDGQVTLLFRDLPEKGVWKIAAWADYDASSVVPKSSFLEALRQARCAIQSKQNEGRCLGLAASIARGITEEHTRHALQWAYPISKGTLEKRPREDATLWLVTFGIWSLDNERMLRFHVSRLTGKKAAKTRKAHAQYAAREVKKARQFVLPLT